MNRKSFRSAVRLLPPRRASVALATALTLLAAGEAAAQWQGIAAQNAAFDARFNQWMAGNQQRLAQSQQQLWQRHLAVNGSRLRAQYAQMRAQGMNHISFEQFAYWDLMTAAGTNVQGAAQAQQRQFEGLQRANATVQQGHASYNAGWAQNSARQSAAVASYNNQAIRGVSPYIDGNGQRTMLPHSLPQGQTYQQGGYTYAQDAQGTYWRWQGNGWARLDATR